MNTPLFIQLLRYHFEFQPGSAAKIMREDNYPYYLRGVQPILEKYHLPAPIPVPIQYTPPRTESSPLRPSSYIEIVLPDYQGVPIQASLELIESKLRKEGVWYGDSYHWNSINNQVIAHYNNYLYNNRAGYVIAVFPDPTNKDYLQLKFIRAGY